jgi:hypothetical protein
VVSVPLFCRFGMVYIIEERKRGKLSMKIVGLLTLALLLCVKGLFVLLGMRGVRF